MNVRLATADDAFRWNEFVSKSLTGSFLQTWAWGDFQEASGQRIWRVVAEGEHGGIAGVALVVEKRVLPGWRWLYVPRGPIWNSVHPDTFAALQSFLQHIARDASALFIRIDPPILKQNVNVNFLQLGWREADHAVQPQDTLLLSLRKTDDELLSAMHSKTRYNIRLAEKKGVTIRFSNSVQDVDVFLRLANEVSGRTSFQYHPAAYYRDLMQILGAFGMAEMAVAEYQGKVLAAHIMVYSGTVATYVHGASSREYRDLMAPHLLYWKTIQHAREKGMQSFDFYGVAPEGAGADHPWSGVTRMKRGFGGDVVSCIPAYDLPISTIFYPIFLFVRTLRQRFR